eukprot:4764317-Pleurochrysis_carterae.AAC.1
MFGGSDREFWIRISVRIRVWVWIRVGVRAASRDYIAVGRLRAGEGQPRTDFGVKGVESGRS